MATPVTGIRIPADLLALIDARAIDGKTRTYRHCDRANPLWVRRYAIE